MPRNSLQIAIEHHRGGRLRRAEAGYRAVLADEPEHPEALHWLGVLTLQTGLADAAIPLLQRAASGRPDDPAFQHNLGQALLSTGRADDAITAFERAAALDRANATTVLSLGLAHLARNARGDAPVALAAFDRAQGLGVDSAELHHHRAVALLKLGRAAEAVAACRAAIERKADYASAHHHLAVALRAGGGANDEARRALLKAVELDPTLARAWHGLAVMEAEAGRLDEAMKRFRRAIELKPDYAAARQALVRLLTKLGRHDEARRVTADAAQAQSAPAQPPCPASVSDAIAELEGKLTPEGKAAGMHYALATMLNVFPPPQSPASGVTKLFDGYAERFDEHLEGKLGYRVPALLAEAVADTKPSRALDVLDLGCGTGLCGAALRPLARRLHGVDLSPAMIEKSTARGVYDELTLADIHDALRRCPPASLDLIVATDVFIYVGDLAPAFEAAAEALRPRGMLAFSVEAAAGERYHLLPTRRYAHSQPYVEHLAGIFGFAVERLTPIPIRMEAGKPLPGYLVLLRVPEAEGR
jgi:predicted TPR repeat methyltransferase